ncbi:MAG: hypothetical protein KAI26_06580, partial [Nanoarchaeota archaeon]|nr:hypothetical protein [Nanoarchaeota archaeon]
VLFYMLFINLNTANNYFKLTYKHTNFDEYYAVSKVIKKYPHQNILVIEPPNFGKFKVTSIYLKNQKNAYIYPSLNYTILELKTLFEENDFSKILKIGHSEDNINEVIEDMGLNINVQSVKS